MHGAHPPHFSPPDLGVLLQYRRWVVTLTPPSHAQPLLCKSTPVALSQAAHLSKAGWVMRSGLADHGAQGAKHSQNQEAFSKNPSPKV